MPKLHTYQYYLGLSARQIDQLGLKNKIKLLKFFRKDYTKYDLRKKIHPNTKRKIARDIDDLLAYKNVPGARVFKVPKKRFKKARKFSGQPSVYKKIIVSTNPSEKLKFKNGNYIIESKYWTKKRVEFNKLKLAKNPEKEIKNKLKKSKFDTANIITGKSVLGGMAHPADIDEKDFIVDEVKLLMNMYDNSNEWLDGVYLYNFQNQKSYKELVKARKKIQNGQKKNRRRG